MGGNVLVDFALVAVSVLGSALTTDKALAKMLSGGKKTAKRVYRNQAGKRRDISDPYEVALFDSCVVNPATMETTFEDIGGLTQTVQDLKRALLARLRQPHLFRASVARQKRGVLLYGPPGTGKTMLARAIAQESGIPMINLKPSDLLSKWYGDSSKLVRAVWSLAEKLQPCILFIDEVDALLGTRTHSEHEVTTALKVEFMQLWDGLESAKTSNIVVLGATNRLRSLDSAVLRRFSRQIEVGLPSTEQRRSILRLVLEKYNREQKANIVAALKVAAAPRGTKAKRMAGVDVTVLEPELLASLEHKGGLVQDDDPLTWLAQRTGGYSGSDLVALVSRAVEVPEGQAIEGAGASGHELPPPLSLAHFKEVLATFQPPSRAASRQEPCPEPPGGLQLRRVLGRDLHMMLQHLLEPLLLALHKVGAAALTRSTADI